MTKPLEALIADMKAAAELSVKLSGGGYKRSHRAAYAKSEFRKLATEENIQLLIAALEQSQRSNAFLKEQLAKLANFNPDWDILQACQASWKEVSAELHSARNHIAELEVSHAQVIQARDHYKKLVSASQVAVRLPAEFAVIGENLRTQNNRITDQPMFVIFEKQEIIGSDEHNPSRIVWCRDGEEVSELRAKRLEALHREYRETNDYDRYAMQEIDVFVTACFTEQGCKDYLALNGHNLRLPYIFAAGSYRNNEYQQVRNLLMTAGTVQGDG